jgi:hypothetical protein
MEKNARYVALVSHVDLRNNLSAFLVRPIRPYPFMNHSYGAATTEPWADAIMDAGCPAFNSFCAGSACHLAVRLGSARSQAVESKINRRGRIKRDELRQEQTSHYCDA